MGNQGARTSESDRTVRAVLTQLRAMSCEQYEIGVRDSVRGVMMTRTWSAAEVEQGVPWLKHVNAQNNDIYIRPAGSLGLILVDDLVGPALDRLRQDGLAPAVVIETSPGNYQAWLRISHEPLQPELASAAARIVAERFGGDANSADWRHFGRLAGFTNRKAKHARGDRKQPYVLVHEARGSVAERAGELLTEAERRRQVAAQPRETPGLPASRAPGTAPGRTPGDAYAYYAARITARHGAADVSRLDWGVCKAIACTTLVEQAYLEQAIREGSPGLQERKVGHVEDYIARTARKVLQDSDVVAARERLAQKLTAQQSSGLTV